MAVIGVVGWILEKRIVAGLVVGVAVIGAIPVKRARIKLPASGDQTELCFLSPVSLKIHICYNIGKFFICVHYALAVLYLGLG